MIEKVFSVAASLVLALPVISIFAPSTEAQNSYSLRGSRAVSTQSYNISSPYSGRVPKTVNLPSIDLTPRSFQQAAGSDYLADIDEQGLFRWPESSFPLRVYIQPGNGVPGYRANFPDMVRDSYDQWAAASQGKISWMEVSSPQEANIVASYNNETPEHSNGTEAGRTRTYTKFNTATSQGIIYKATVGLATRLPDRGLSDEEMRKTTLHEVGHSLGLAGHSPTHTDIMFAQVSPRMIGRITPRDQATLLRLYQGYSNVARSPRTPGSV